jgi:hypothetical protein
MPTKTMRISSMLPIVLSAAACAAGDSAHTSASDMDAASGVWGGLDAGGSPSANEAHPRFPIGHYLHCAQGLRNEDNNHFPNVSGFRPGRVLTLTQSEQTVVAKFVDSHDTAQSLQFTTSTQVTATLARPGDVISGFSSMCVTGLGLQTGYPAAMSVSSGILTSSAGMVFVTLKGRLQSDSGSCGMLTQPDASSWSICRDRESDLQPPAAEPPSIAEAPVGDYECALQLDTHRTLGGKNYYFATGGSGPLEVTRDSLNVSALYAGDTTLSGTLSLDPKTSMVAVVKSGQTLTTSCVGLTGEPESSDTPEEVPIEAGSLAMVDSTLFLSIAGDTSEASSCPGVRVAASLMCRK